MTFLLGLSCHVRFFFVGGVFSALMLPAAALDLGQNEVSYLTRFWSRASKRTPAQSVLIELQTASYGIVCACNDL